MFSAEVGEGFRRRARVLQRRREYISKAALNDQVLAKVGPMSRIRQPVRPLRR